MQFASLNPSRTRRTQPAQIFADASSRGRSGRMARMLVAVTLIGLTSAVISGCGFHLRGKVALSKSLTPLAISGGDVELVGVIREALEFSGTPVVDSPQSAAAVLRLRQARVGRTVRTTDTRGLATSYLLRYVVRFDVVNAAGDTLMKETRLRLRRDLDFDSTQILQKEDEQRFLVEDMQREIAQSILRRLSVVATAPLEPAVQVAGSSVEVARPHSG